MPDFHVNLTETAASITASDTEIARYVFVDDGPAFEGPKPYLHPLRSLSGATLTDYRPSDHRWHKGLQMTLTDVSGQNFWGGNTYVHGTGYVALDNVGYTRHDGFTGVGAGKEGVLDENLTWVTRAGEDWFTEQRSLRFHGLDVARGLWQLDVGVTLRNISGRELVLGSPTTNGRPDAGYSGLFLRMAPSFTGAQVTSPELSASGTEADVLMGSAGPWLAISSTHAGGATIIAFAGTTTAPAPPRWFVRSEPEPVLAPSPTFEDTITLADDDELVLSHRLVFIDHSCTQDEIIALATELTPERAS